MTTLADRIRAALADEALRLMALPPWPWKLNAEGDDILAADDEEICTGWALSSEQQRAVAAYIVDNGPSVKLRQIDAHRKILDLHAPSEYRIFRGGVAQVVLQCDHCASLCHSGSGLACDSPDAPYPCETVQIVAEAYGVEA